LTIKIFVGERNYSSWSLRPWLALTWSGLPFEEEFISLDQPGYGEGGVAAVKAISPSGRVPALHVEDLIIWDSLAICEWIAEAAPGALLWPKHPTLRAQARAATCEMHSGFQALRRDLPMNIRRRCAAQDWPADTKTDLERLAEMWRHFRELHFNEGPFLFGHRTIADAFFAPVAARLRTYSVSLGAIEDEYRDVLLDDAAFKRWERRALDAWKAPFSRANLDELYSC
jgi:glutathione S-transferase